MDLGKLSARACTGLSTGVYTGTWEFLSSQAHVDALNQGNALLHSACRVGDSLDEKQKNIIKSFFHLSFFQDEVKENNVPLVDLDDMQDAAKYTVIMVKNTYLIADVDMALATPEVVSSVEYVRACIPGNPTVWDAHPDFPNTFRITKPIIPVVYDITAQFKVSAIAQDKLAALSVVDGVPVHHALLLERTKRNIAIVDFTAKAKTLLTYTQIDGGLLVSNVTVLMNTALPRLAAMAVDRMGSWVSAEGAETASRTRAYLRELAEKAAEKAE